MNAAAFAEPREAVMRPSIESSANADITARTCDSATEASAATGWCGSPADAQATAPNMAITPVMPRDRIIILFIY
jgi:hypothetical protein